MLSPARTLKWTNNGKSIVRKWVNFHLVLRRFIIRVCTGWPSLTFTNTTIYAPTLLTTRGQSINNHHPLLWQEVATISFLLLLRSNLPRGCFPSLTEEPVIIHWLGDPGWVLSVWKVWMGELSVLLDLRCGVCVVLTWLSPDLWDNGLYILSTNWSFGALLWENENWGVSRHLSCKEFNTSFSLSDIVDVVDCHTG